MSITWSEFKAKVDKQLAEQCPNIEDPEIWYIDIAFDDDFEVEITTIGMKVG